MKKKKVTTVIQLLVEQGLKGNLIEFEDEVYVRNQILHLLQLKDFQKEDLPTDSSEANIPDLVVDLVDYAVAEGLISNLLDEKEILMSSIMNCFMSKPSEINHKFYRMFNDDPRTATDYFYTLSKNSNYIQMKRINKNIEYKAETQYGKLDITINLSKPEKDPKEIQLEKELKQDANYPACLLCMENEGYAGRIGHPARSNHRMIRVALNEEGWLLQYSPYVYYNEHCILLSEEHRDMRIQEKTFATLLAFVEKFPHYFIGSNADLPIVGGSILSHDHYQGGRYDFAMAKAEEEFKFQLSAYPNIDCSTVKWPMSVIRLRGDNKGELVQAASYILEQWKGYSDETVDIIAFTKNTPHNTITPIVRKKGEQFEVDLVLRNNRTTERHPSGIFHPHADVQHIKKENIGLIEVMGLAVLPKRLEEELEEVEQYILESGTTVKDYHLSWANELKEEYTYLANSRDIKEYLREKVGQKFLRVLEDAGVFKRDNIGQNAFRLFTDSLNGS
ncbi:UDP-glucose--hexose-1-phosphate uridylyltransferase [Sutcliffiella deserti]|uniref:UDP-glucose--hexose-1-phosphate uridylyltransferase n=1 Tax=Sutcliffiella deserti TaxID=2875501 RepID=UPI001CBCE578|nr:UDP-glucose--hexose-1-phosphate uridylyltransferase [Sutcliffiella deserti]